MRGRCQEDEHAKTNCPLHRAVSTGAHQQHLLRSAARASSPVAILIMNNIPNLAGIATSEMVEHIGTGKFAAAYVNWSRTMALLREHAPGWQPELVNAPDGYILHQAPVGAYLMIRFRNGEATTSAVPQAIMDNRNAAIPLEKITARDITDTHRRGVCMAAAFTFGLAYELWAKLPLESGYAEAAPQPAMKITHAEADKVSALINEVGADRVAFLAWVEKMAGHPVPTEDEIPAAALPAVNNALEKKRQQKETT